MIYKKKVIQKKKLPYFIIIVILKNKMSGSLVIAETRNEELIRVEVTMRLPIRNIRLPQTDI